MEAFPSPSRSGSGTGDRVQWAAVLVAVTSLAMGFQVAAQEQAPVQEQVQGQGQEQEQIPAVWKVREISFLYRSSTSIYACSALQGRVASILRAIGARDDIDVRVDDCRFIAEPPDLSSNRWQAQQDRFRNPSTSREQASHVRVRLMTPIEVTPEVLAELDRDKSRRELVSRVTGDPAAKFNDPVLFPAKWQTVTLSHRSIGLEPEECELLEQMSMSVIPQLGMRVVRKGFVCNPRQVSRIPPVLTVEALMGIPYETPTALQPPVEGEAEPEPSEPAASDPEPTEPETDSTAE